MSTYAAQKWWDANTVAVVTGSNKGQHLRGVLRLNTQWHL
jgi:hypothetical protein